MKILVTGSTGFIGAALCHALVQAGHSVRAFQRASSSPRLLAGLEVEPVIGDLTRPETLTEAMQGIEVVFHAAALLGGGRDQPGRYYAVTVEGTRAVLRAALDAGVRRLVHTSSVAALGVPPRLPGRWAATTRLNEHQTWNFRADRWPYGYAKYLAELEVQAAVAAGLDAVIVSPSIVLGAGDIYRQTNSVVVQVARRRLPMVVEGGLNVVHIQDVVAGHLAAMERGRTGERYILAHDNMTVAEFIERIAELTNVPAPGIILPGGLVRRLARPYSLLEGLLPLPVSAKHFYLAGYYFYYDNRKSRVDLNLEYTHSLDQAIGDAYTWFVETGSIPV